MRLRVIHRCVDLVFVVSVLDGDVAAHRPGHRHVLVARARGERLERRLDDWRLAINGGVAQLLVEADGEGDPAQEGDPDMGGQEPEPVAA